MKTLNRRRRVPGLLLTVLFSPIALCTNALAQQCADLDPDNTHVYHLYAQADVPWSSARDLALAKSEPIIAGDPDSPTVAGHLVSIDSADEFALVHCLLAGAIAAGSLDATEVWTGGHIDDQGTWIWLDGSAIPLVNSTEDGVFAQWQPDEPSKGAYLTLGNNFGKANGAKAYVAGYSSEASPPKKNIIGGYIVEFDIEPFELCLTLTGCGTRQTTLVFPQSATGLGVGFVTSEVFLDPRLTSAPGEPPVCDGTVLPLDGGKLTIPGYLCGSPYLQWTKLIGYDVKIPDGTIFATTTQLAANGGEAGSYSCASPGNGNPQNRARLVWETSEFVNGEPYMRENLVGNEFLGNDDGSILTISVPPQPPIAGLPSAGSFTSDCGSTEGRLRTNSYLVNGMHLQCVNPGLYGGDPWALYPEFVLECFVRLADNKIDMLVQAVEQSFAEGVLSTGDYQGLLTRAESARTRLLAGAYREAEAHIVSFLDFASRAAYGPNLVHLGFNDDGEHEMRGSNVLFILQHDIIPNEP